MKKIPKSLLTLGLLITSCGIPKQYSSCNDIPNSLNGTFYDELVKQWGQPVKEEERGQDWFVIWSGVGINGKDKELMFTTTTNCDNCTTEVPFKFEGVECK